MRGILHESDARRVPLTRNSRYAQISTSPRKRGEVSEPALLPIRIAHFLSPLQAAFSGTDTGARR